GERALSPAELERLCARQEPGAAAAPGPARGRRVFARAGCLACHALAGAGNDGPGPALDGIGDRLPGSAIRRALVSPTPPMPAYDHLSRKDLDGLVAYLAAQRAGRP
ncbi:MAG TPA: cytochrome c, partial [Baekduia sp.]|nr:cytochrome c [Baekduia sp.]